MRQAAPQTNRVFGVDAVYVRGTERFALDDLLIDEDTRQVETPEGAVFVANMTSFLVRQDASPFAGSFTEPQKGDRIIRCVRGKDRAFRMLEEPGIPGFVPDDVHEHRFRIYTKEVSS